MKIFSTMLLLIGFVTSFAQDGKLMEAMDNIHIYGGIEGEFGNYVGIGASLNGIWQKNAWGLSVSYLERNASNVPDDYSGKALFTVGSGAPKQELKMGAATYGWALPAKNSLTRYVLRAGISVGVVETPTNYTSVSGSFLYGNGPNYDYDYAQRTAIGFVVNPGIEFPCSRGFGFSLSFTANFNTISSSYTGNFGVLFGRLRKRSVHYWKTPD